jgi:hypothetical protein
VDEQADQGARRSRRAALRALPTPTDLELTVEDAPPLLEVIDELPEPRIAELDALLREVDGLRSTLRRDLTLAATAAEAGEDDFAGWLLLGDDGHIRSFEERALEHLQQLEAEEAAETAVLVPAPRRRRRMLPAAPMVAACAALFGFLTGSVPGLPGSQPTSPATSNVAALDSYAKLTSLATSGASEDSISAAAAKFHASLAPLVAQAQTNPAAAEKAIALLNSERVVIAASPDSPALRAVLRQADLLVARLRAHLPKKPLPVVVPQQQPKKSTTTTKSSPAPKPSPTASPKPAPKPSPTTAPKATPSPSPSNPLPAAPFH